VLGASASSRSPPAAPYLKGGQGLEFEPDLVVSDVASDGHVRLDTGRGPRGRRRALPWVRWVVALSILAVIGGGTYYWLSRRQAPVRYVTAPVTRGTVAVALTATGTVNPVTVVEVGTYVSGPIVKWSCDFNTRVTVGQLCAQIDPRPFQMVADQAAANLAVARAQLVKDRAGLVYAKTTYERDSGLLERGIVSQATLDNEKSTYDQAVAQITYDESAIQERQAEVNAAQVNLGFTRIISPVNGVVVSRNIEIGQTVAASFQTPILFLIATDLTKMQVDTNVSESDIGGVKVGDPATFSVQTFPNRQFEGTVRQVRQAPTTVQNVVTYDVVVDVDNRDGALRPGMTATTRIVKAERDDVLMLPEQALRFRPEGVAGERGGGGSRRTDRAAASGGDGTRRGRAWILRDGKPAAVPLVVGLEDGTSAEITKGELAEGDQVIVAEATTASKSGPGAGQAPRFFQPGSR
jgi:HlyD family secretion protein